MLVKVMRMIHRKELILILALIFVVMSLAEQLLGREGLTWSTVEVETTEASSMLHRQGEELYQAACVSCHGIDGKGDGLAAAYLFTKPRDLTSATFKIRSTPTGSLPTDEDLYRTITAGFPEYGMPQFAYLTPQERWALVSYIKEISPTFRKKQPKAPMDIVSSPAVTGDLLADGQELYQKAECWKCHGMEGRGDGPAAASFKDLKGNPVMATDFTQGPRAFKRGSSPRDIVQTLLTGLSGSPMPAYGGAFTERQLWAIAYYVESLAKGDHKE